MKPGSGHVALNTGHATEFCVTSEKPRPRRLSSFLSSQLYYDPWNRDGGRLKHKLYAKNNLKATQYSLMTRFNIQYLTVIFCYSDTFVQ